VGTAALDRILYADRWIELIVLAAAAIAAGVVLTIRKLTN